MVCAGGYPAAAEERAIMRWRRGWEEKSLTDSFGEELLGLQKTSF